MKETIGGGTYGTVYQSENFKQRVDKEYKKPVDKIAITYAFELFKGLLPVEDSSRIFIYNEETLSIDFSNLSEFELRSLIFNLADAGLFTKGMPLDHLTYLIANKVNLDFDLDYELLVQINLVIDRIKEYLVSIFLSGLKTSISEFYLHSFGLHFKPQADGKYIISFETEKWSEQVSVSLDLLFSDKFTFEQYVTLLTKLVDIAKAIDLMNANGLTHLDIKPTNFFFRNYGGIPDVTNANYLNGEFILGDFGITSVINSRWNFMVDRLAGTVGYIAPEAYYNPAQERNKYDVYSFAITICELLTGKVPKQFNSRQIAYYNNEAETLDNVQSSASAIPSTYSNLDIDSSFKEEIIKRLNVSSSRADIIISILYKATAVLPENRYNSCQEFIERLLAVLY